MVGDYQEPSTFLEVRMFKTIIGQKRLGVNVIYFPVSPVVLPSHSLVKLLFCVLRGLTGCRERRKSRTTFGAALFFDGCPDVLADYFAEAIGAVFLSSLFSSLASFLLVSGSSVFGADFLFVCFVVGFPAFPHLVFICLTIGFVVFAIRSLLAAA